MNCITGYLTKNATALAAAARKAAPPLHDPEVDPVHPGLSGLKRQPLASRTNAQAHAITASIKLLEHQRGEFFVGACGVGKTFGSISTIHLHAAGQGYRACVMCPGHIAPKWGKEIRKAIHDVRVTRLTGWRDVAKLIGAADPVGPEWYIIGRDKAKLGANWKPALMRYSKIDLPGICPQCGQVPLDGHGNAPLSEKALADSKRKCQCGSPLWTATNGMRRWPPAKIIQRKLGRGFFKYVVGDEAHELANADSDQAAAFGAIASVADYKLALTGTLSNGKAESLRSLLFQICPADVVRRGIRWSDASKFNESYGRLETTKTKKVTSLGKKSSSSSRRCAPGIMPGLFGHLLVGSSVFLTLDQVADDLPPLTTELIPVPLDQDMREDYDRLDQDLRAAAGRMLRRGDRRLLGPMVSTLLAWPDCPFKWEDIGYFGDNGFVGVAKPKHYDHMRLLAKEKRLARLVREEREVGRKTWVYVEYTDKHDVAGRLEAVLKRQGNRVKVLRSDVDPEDREDWVAKHAPGVDVMISQKSLVQTGVDLFDNAPRTFNFPTLCFYEFGYKTTDLRQAAARHLRIGQDQPCRTVYLYHVGSMADRGLKLMGQKVQAAEQIEGKFTFDGLASLGEDDSIEQALIKSVADELLQAA